MATERVYTIPLRREWLKAVRYQRAKKAIRGIKEFLMRHMKVEMSEIKLGTYLNIEIWKHGIKNPPSKIKVNVIKDDKGLVRAELVGAPVKIEEPKKGVKAPAKPVAVPAKPEVKPAEKKPEVKPAETKPTETKSESAPAEKKPEVKPAETKPTETKPVEKPAEKEVKPAAPKPAEKKPEEKKEVKPAEKKPEPKPAGKPVATQTKIIQ